MCLLMSLQYCLHNLHCGHIISSGGLNVAIFQLRGKLWWLKSGLFSLKVGGILIFQSGNTAWLNSAKVAYFGTLWRVKKWWRKPPKKWLIFGSIKILAKKGQNSNFNLDLGIIYAVISKLC